MAWTDPRTWVAGEKPPASTWNAHVRDNLNALRWQWIRKTADEALQNNTFQDDNHLLIPIGASETWTYEMTLYYTGPSTADLKIAFTVPASATGHWGAMGPESGIVTIGASSWTNRAYNAFGDANLATFGSLTDAMMVVAKGLVINSTTPGNITLRWAQSSTVASDTTMRANSFALAHRLS